MERTLQIHQGFLESEEIKMKIDIYFSKLKFYDDIEPFSSRLFELKKNILMILKMTLIND
jgi:hypothetical protein